jgi:hypothetical protein
MSLTIPTIVKSSPDQNKMLVKKAYYVTENVVSSLINDSSIYPDKTSDNKWGFDDQAAISYENTTYSGASKFARLFATKINTLTVASDYKFTSSEGMVWDLTACQFSNSTASCYLVVDVNGDKAPNCCQGVKSTCAQCAKDCSAGTETSNYDQFCIDIKPNGKMSLPANQTNARDAITAGAKLRK